MLPDQIPELTLGRRDDAGDGTLDLRETALLLEVALLRLQAHDLGLLSFDLLAARARQQLGELALRLGQTRLGQGQFLAHVGQVIGERDLARAARLVELLLLDDHVLFGLLELFERHELDIAKGPYAFQIAPLELEQLLGSGHGGFLLDELLRAHASGLFIPPCAPAYPSLRGRDLFPRHRDFFWPGPDPQHP